MFQVKLTFVQLSSNKILYCVVDPPTAAAAANVVNTVIFYVSMVFK